MTTAAGPKLGYVEWQRFRDNLHELRKRYSWSELSQMFGKQDSPGWAERADQHRGLVSKQDVYLSQRLVLDVRNENAKPESGPPAPPPVAAVRGNGKHSDLNEHEIAEARKRLNAAYEQFGTWTGVTRRLGKNPKSSGQVKYAATGKLNPSRTMLTRLRQLANGVPIEPAEAPRKGRHRAVRAKKSPLKPSEQAEVQRRLQALRAAHGTWAAVKVLVTDAPGSPNHYNKVALYGGGSWGLLQKLRKLDPTQPKPVENPPPTVRPIPAITPRADPAMDQPWPVRAQHHLRAAKEIIERGVAELPKSLRGGSEELVTHVMLCIEALDTT